MTNDECQMTKEDRSPKPEFRRKPEKQLCESIAEALPAKRRGVFLVSDFDIRVSDFFRHLAFVIRISTRA